MNTLLKGLYWLWGLLMVLVIVNQWSDLTPWAVLLLAGLLVTAVYNAVMLRPDCRGAVLLVAMPLNLASVTITARPWVLAMMEPTEAFARMNRYDLSLLEMAAMGLGLVAPLLVLALHWRGMTRAVSRWNDHAVSSGKLTG